ncbi:MAG: hypothetical protein WCC59_05760 [Terriglobales bacterium]
MLCRHRLAISCAVAISLAGPCASQEATPIGEIFASDASVKGAVQLAGAGMQVMSESSVGAGQAPALLRLTRGGEVRVCPRTSLSISGSRNGLMLGMNSGAIETDYSLFSAPADAIFTPDFRIMLAGPGKIHVAVGADARGNTCIRPLANNTATVIVSELMSGGTYQLKPDEQVIFERGKVADVYHVVGECGCPGPPPVVRAAAVPQAPSIASLRKPPLPPSLAIPLDAPQPPQPVASSPAGAPAPAANDVHVEVDAPFVFSGSDPEPAPMAQIVQLRFSSAAPLTINPQPPRPPEFQPAPLSPAPTVVVEVTPKKKKGFFGKVRSFFASVFH